MRTRTQQSSCRQPIPIRDLNADADAPQGDNDADDMQMPSGIGQMA